MYELSEVLTVVPEVNLFTERIVVPFESVSIYVGRNYEIFSAIFYLVQDLNLDQLHLKEKKSILQQ